jgi:hypothetical protein
MIIGLWKSKYTDENLPYWRFVHHKSHMNCPGIEHGPPQREIAWALTRPYSGSIQ